MRKRKTTKFLFRKVLHKRDPRLRTGYIKDQEKHEVELTWDTTAGSINDIRDDDKVPDKEDPFGNGKLNVSKAFMCWKKAKN